MAFIGSTIWGEKPDFDQSHYHAKMQIYFTKTVLF